MKNSCVWRIVAYVFALLAVLVAVFGWQAVATVVGRLLLLSILTASVLVSVALFRDVMRPRPGEDDLR